MNRTWLLLLSAVTLAAAGGCAKRVVRHPPPDVPPPTPPVTVRESSPTSRSHRVTHEVLSGETLAMIADNYYGDPGRAGEIARDNGLREPERLVAGSSLVLRFSAAEWAIAEKRAAAMLPYNRGVDAFGEGRLEEAAAEFQKALAIAPDFKSASYNLALVHGRRGRYEDAERLLAALLAERPREPDVLLAYGNVLFHQTRFDAAIAEFRRLLQLDPGHRQAAFSMARALQEAGRRDEAITAWRAYLRLDSQSVWAEAARQALRDLGGD